MAAPAETGADAITEDWDSLLDSVTVEPEPAEPTAPTPASIPEAPEALAPSRSDALAEAEQLMQSLDRQREMQAAPTPPPQTPSGASVPSLLPQYPPSSPSSVELDADLAYDYSAAPARRRSKRHSRVGRKGRKILKLLAMIVVLAACGAAAYVGISRALEQAEDLRTQATRLEDEGRYTEASRVYDRLANKASASPPARADAMFRSAYVLTLGNPQSGDEKNRRYRMALNQFASFVEAFPQHPKKTRALTIMGRLHYELEEYEEAIAILRDQADPTNDAQAALAMLRYLARSYSQIGEYEAAESAYLQAATFPGNYTVDQDYYRLGEMYELRANLAEDPADERRFEQTAAEYWRRAVQVPGIEPSQKAELNVKLEMLDYQEGGETATNDPGAGEAAAPDLSAETPTEAAPAEPAPEPGPADRLEDPAAEMPAAMTLPESTGSDPAEPEGAAEAVPVAE